MFAAALRGFFAATAFVLFHALIAAASPAGGCKDYLLISARGFGEVQGPSPSVGGMINRTLSTVPNGAVLDVVYPATFSFIDTAQGVSWVTAHIQDALRTCPKLKIGLVAYCQGTLVHASAATQLLYSAPVRNAIRAFVFTGSPIHAPGRPGNVDEKGGTTDNSQASGESVLDYPIMFDHFVDGGKVLSICNSRGTRDPVCDTRGTGDLGPHREYGALDSVQRLGSEFLAKHLQD